MKIEEVGAGSRDAVGAWCRLREKRDEEALHVLSERRVKDCRRPCHQWQRHLTCGKEI